MKHKYVKLKAKEDDKKSKKLIPFNYGLALLKLVSAFLVLVNHNFKPDTTNNKLIIFITKSRKFHVPSFFIMSFYFTYKSLLSLKPKKIINRFIRLFVPYIGWALIFWKMNNIWNKKYNTTYPDTYEDLKLQLLWAYRFITDFWYLWNLIVITFFFNIVIFIFRKHSVFVFQIILIFCYAVQYSGYHYQYVFKRFPEDKGGIVFACFFEDVPYAVTGFTLGYYKIIDIIQKHKIKTLILCLVVYNFFDDYMIFITLKGVIYPGIKYNIRAICVTFIFSLFPSDKITNKYIAKFLTIITNHTAGVYYMHLSIRFYLMNYFDDIKNRNFKSMIMTYIIIYIICFLGTLIFGKTPIKYLFC